MPAILDRLAERRRAARARDRYAAFRAHVEPALAARPRVHRFAAPPVVGEETTPVTALEVCIDPSGGGDPEATRASLERGTVAPAAVVEALAGEALASGRAEWLVIVEAGDRLAPLALERLGQAAALAPDAALVTCDEDRLDAAGERLDPIVRPGPSPDFLLARDLVGALVCVRREAALEAGGLPPGGGAPGRYALALALAGPAGAGHAHAPMILCHRGGPVAGDDDAALAAAAQAELRARGEIAARVEVTGPGRRRVRRPAPGEPSVEVIVCFRDRPDLLRRCARSLLERTAWERLRLRLVDNGSMDPDVTALLEELRRDERVVVSRDDRPFNFSALNNAAAAASQAELLVFLNSDTEVVEPAWVETMLEEAVRDEVGAVSPLLCFEDGRVQHAGAAIGLHGYAGHPFAGLRPDRLTPFGSARDGTRNWLAVTAACLMVERRKLASVGGFDEGFEVAGNDVDLGLRLTAAGYRSLCVPHTQLVHDESSSRDPRALPAGDLVRSRERYGAFRTVGDPFYSPSLTHAGTDCALRAPEEELPA